jgi:hypothetical protein
MKGASARSAAIMSCPACNAALAPRQTVTLEQASERLGISHKVIRRLIESNTIPATQVVPWAPWEIPIEAIESPDVVQEVARAKRRPRKLTAVNGPSIPMFAEIGKILELK